MIVKATPRWATPLGVELIGRVPALPPSSVTATTTHDVSFQDEDYGDVPAAGWEPDEPATTFTPTSMTQRRSRSAGVGRGEGVA
jgi:hypothetical protein